MEQVHGQRAGLDLDVADFFGLSQGFVPRRLARRSQRIDRITAIATGFRGQTMVGSNAIGSEGVKCPVLQEKMHGSSQGRRPSSQYRSGLQLVIGPREEDE
jgi:hypothetical protein